GWNRAVRAPLPVRTVVAVHGRNPSLVRCSRSGDLTSTEARPREDERMVCRASGSVRAVTAGVMEIVTSRQGARFAPSFPGSRISGVRTSNASGWETGLYYTGTTPSDPAPPHHHG